MQVATMKSFIALNKAVLTQFGKDMVDISALPGMEASNGFMTAVVQAGVALALREVSHFAFVLMSLRVSWTLTLHLYVPHAILQILHLGLSDSMQIYAPFLKASLASVAASVDPWGEREACTPLYSLAFDAGVVPELDLALVASLSPLKKTAEDAHCFSLLPAAFAACFALPYWTQNSIFLPEFGAFRGNQHCVALTVAKLLLCFSRADESSFPSELKKSADSFVELSASVILSMRDSSSAASFNNHPVRAYTNILELFLARCPLVDHYSLEKFLPYAFVHASQMEIAMGQVRNADSLSAGMDRVIRAKSAVAE